MDNQKSGALRGELLTKTLILYVLRHFECPLPADMLTDLTMDRVADRLEYTAALGDLERSELVMCSDDGYGITPFGRQTLEAVENEIPASTRQHASRDIETALDELRRRAAIGGDYAVHDGAFAVMLTLGEGDTPDVTLRMTYPSEESASRAVRRWKADANDIYKELLTRLG